MQKKKRIFNDGFNTIPQILTTMEHFEISERDLRNDL